METRKWYVSILLLGLITLFSFFGCSGKKKGFLPLLALVAMDDDGSSSGQTSDEDLLSTSTSQVGTAESGSTSESIGPYSANVPGGLNVTGSSAGDFTGITYYAGDGHEATGFLSTVPDGGTTNSTDLSVNLITQMVSDASIATADVVSANTINNADGNTSIYNIAITTTSAMTVSDLGNILAKQLGLSTENILVTQPNESSSAEFRVVMQVTFSNTTDEVMGVGISTESNYTSNEAVLTGFLDGTNIIGSGSDNLTKNDSFIAKGNPKVDIVWVVDNSGSMKEEQGAVIANAGAFFTQLNNKNLDFRLAAITTDSEKIVFSGNSKKPPRTGWTTAADGSTAFVNNVSAGLKGSGTEAGIWFAEKSITTGTVVPRSGASLVFVMLSDEGDQYECKQNKTSPNNSVATPCGNPPANAFDPNNNIFKDNGYKVYAIIGLNSAGQPSTCSGSGTKAAAKNNGWPGYYNLSQATGGMAGTICSNDYSQLLNSIVSQAAAAASSYKLTYIPMSSTMVVKKNGVTVPKDSTNGWMYNASNNSIVFSGTAFPSVNDVVVVAYEYSPSAQAQANHKGSLYAYLSGNNTVGMLFALFILVAGVSMGYLIKRRYA
ncbi:MAG: VWA domain-containing protein [Leptospiraceae bacterium]|nr:VWA domain-containing protein [Leptospiraceae bacterium]MCP5495942.1 VWA domain-containing protein [Leptospiraceae bacterium]